VEGRRRVIKRLLEFLAIRMNVIAERDEAWRAAPRPKAGMLGGRGGKRLGVVDIACRYVKQLGYAALITSAIVLAGGCETKPRPHLRAGAYFGSVMEMYFPDPEHLGKHGYNNSPDEKDGMVYTCRGGFIDIGHVREAADRTAYIAGVTFDNLMNGKSEFSFKAIEPSRYFVTVQYPKYWEDSPAKEKVASEVSIRLGEYLAETTTIWHEIITWFGYTSTGVFSEYISSFSWEDTYSDLLGTHLGAIALRDSGHEYDDAMTRLIDEELKRLGVQPADIAREAMKKIEGKWYTGGLYFFVTMNKRNFDIGLDDGFITPWLVPGICPGSKPQSYAVPNLDFLAEYGFSVKVEIEPRIFEEGKILRIIYPNGKGRRIEPAVHFRAIMEHIRKEAIEKYGAEVEEPQL